jgi:hypothetical protein
MVGLFWPPATVKEKDIPSRVLRSYLLKFPQLINHVLSWFYIGIELAATDNG